LDADIISLDLSIRYNFHFKYGSFSCALERGVKIEMCYAPGILSSDSAARRNLIQNASSLIRATRGRGILISSEAANALGCRAPQDVVNLATIWGLGQERAMEAVTEVGRSVVAAAELRKRSYRGAVDIVYGGEKPTPSEGNVANGKRKAEPLPVEVEKPVSKNEMRRRIKRAKIEEDRRNSRGGERGTEDQQMLSSSTGQDKSVEEES
jgi:ribonuclease P/MRP protein subunit RPP1